MTDTASNQWRELIGGAFALQFDAFQRVATLPHGLWFAWLVVLSNLSLTVELCLDFANQFNRRRWPGH